jgi:hypothetical protein
MMYGIPNTTGLLLMMGMNDDKNAVAEERKSGY